MAMVLGDELL